MPTFKKNLFSMVGLSLISYPLSFLNQMLMSHYFGTSYQVDAFWVTITIVNLTIFYIHPARESLIPEFFKKYNKSKEESMIYFSMTFNFVLLLVSFCLLLLFFFPDLFLELVDAKQQQTREQTKQLLIFAFPLVIITSISETLNGLLTSLNKVIFQGLGKVLGTICSIVFLLLLAKHIHIYALISALICSLVWLFVLQCRALARVKFRYRFFQKPKADRKFMRMFGTLTLGYFASQIYTLYERNTFTSFGDGVIAAFQYGMTLSQIPQIIFVQSLSVSLWPQIMRFWEDKKNDAMFSIIFASSKQLLVVLCFINLFCWLFAEELIYFFYYRGAFDDRSQWLTSEAFRALVMAMSPIGLTMVLGRFLVTIQQTKLIFLNNLTITILGILTLFITRKIDMVELSFFHMAVANVGGALVYIVAVFYFYSKLCDKDLFLAKKLFWAVRLVALCITLAYLYPVSVFEKGDKFLMTFTLTGHAIAILILFLIGTILFRVLTIGEYQKIIIPIFRFLKKKIDRTA